MSEKRDLYFQNSRGEYRLLMRDVTEEEAFKEMRKFMDEHNFKSYYTRSWEMNGVTTYDVGSWTEFFLWSNRELK